MRQAGVLAAAGLIALEEMPQRLSQDHRNARLLAEAVANEASAEVDLDSVQTNIVIFALKGEGDAPAFCAALKQKGILSSAIGPHSVRLVTHYDVDRSACEEAAGLIVEQLKALS
jgi:threonine aldolase